MSKETLRLVLVKKTITKGKNKFNTYFTIMKLPEEPNGEAIQHSVTVKFRKDVDTSSFGKRGIITVDKKEISAPTLYQITKDENGNDVYPTIWIRSYEDYCTTKSNPIQQSMFVVEDEEETQEVEFES